MVTDIIYEIKYKTARSGGKGGQNVNKVETMVEGYWQPLAWRPSLAIGRIDAGDAQDGRTYMSAAAVVPYRLLRVQPALATRRVRLGWPALGHALAAAVAVHATG